LALVEPEHERCPRCGATKPLEEFAVSAKNRGYHGKGRATICRACDAARLREYRRNKRGHA
jgi:hypothetical protein